MQLLEYFCGHECLIFNLSYMLLMHVLLPCGLEAGVTMGLTFGLDPARSTCPSIVNSCDPLKDANLLRIWNPTLGSKSSNLLGKGSPFVIIQIQYSSPICLLLRKPSGNSQGLLVPMCYFIFVFQKYSTWIWNLISYYLYFRKKKIV